MIGMDYDALNMCYEQLTKIVDDMVDQILEISTVVNKMDNSEHWDGKGYDSYNKKIDNLCRNFKAYCNDLYTLNNNIKTSIKKYKDIDRKVNKGMNL